jgi:hypothetical protein
MVEITENNFVNENKETGELNRNVNIMSKRKTYFKKQMED